MAIVALTIFNKGVLIYKRYLKRSLYLHMFSKTFSGGFKIANGAVNIESEEKLSLSIREHLNNYVALQDTYTHHYSY